MADLSLASAIVVQAPEISWDFLSLGDTDPHNFPAEIPILLVVSVTAFALRLMLNIETASRKCTHIIFAGV